MESFEHQEMRERRRLSWQAIGLAGFVAGAYTFFMTGGSPWTSLGFMDAVMGRRIMLPMGVLLLLHLALAQVYAAIIGASIRRLRLIGAMAMGMVVGFLLYLANGALFSSFGGGNDQSPESQAIFCHLAFGLLAAAVYKGAAVPPPLPEEPGAPKQRVPAPEEVAAPATVRREREQKKVTVRV